MQNQSYNVVGVMSGTSLDGIDLAHISLHLKNGSWQYTVHEAATKTYTHEWAERLKEAVDYSPEQLEDLNTHYTALLGKTIHDFIESNNLRNIDAVCSHGHTILHQPDKGFTLQIGNLPAIAAYTGFKTVCDFRVEDVALGGQGAPLVPIGDSLLFGRYDACLNLGGFSNISFEAGGKRKAFDICAVNTVCNYYANRLGFDYDDKGSIAASGNVNDMLLQMLNALDYYSLSYPKSLGIEYVKETLLPLIDGYDLATEDKLATFTEHIAIQISEVIRQGIKAKKVLVTGGGVYNEFLITRIKEFCVETAIVIPDDKTIQYKEALIFALLGVLRLRGDINVYASVTGARHDHSSGKIYNP